MTWHSSFYCQQCGQQVAAGEHEHLCLPLAKKRITQLEAAHVQLRAELDSALREAHSAKERMWKVGHENEQLLSQSIPTAQRNKHYKHYSSMTARELCRFEFDDDAMIELGRRFARGEDCGKQLQLEQVFEIERRATVKAIKGARNRIYAALTDYLNEKK